MTIGIVKEDRLASDARDRMVDSAVRLLATRGLQATSFSEVLDASGAPRGSIYHHFPGGKDQLVDAALGLTDGRLQALLDRLDGRPAAEVAAAFLGAWRAVLERSNFRAGCAVVAVTVATDSPDLLAHTAKIFRQWRTRLAELLTHGGVPEGEASRLASLLVAASEGAVVVSRAEQSMDPFDEVCETLMAHFS